MTISTRHFLILALVFFLLPTFAHAAMLRAQTNISSVRVGDTFTVAVSLDTQSTTINALDGVLAFTPNLKLSSIRLDGSLIPLWIDTPTQQLASVVNFTGILPGGYKSSAIQKNTRSHGNIFTLVFTAVSSGTARVAFGPKTSAYLNDGKGTQAQLTTPVLTFQIGAISASKQKALVSLDKTPPERFTPVIMSGEPFGYKGNVLIFTVQDKGSGISNYEIARSYFENPTFSNISWETVKSPYRLSSKDSDKFLFIRAIDRAHNVRISRVSPQHISMNALIHRWWMLGLIILSLSIILFFFTVRFLRR